MNQSILALITFPSFFYQGACVTVAAVMQYFFMAALCWMLVEGIYLYLFVVKVYNVSHRMAVYHGISWGMSQCDFFCLFVVVVLFVLVIVIVTVYFSETGTYPIVIFVRSDWLIKYLVLSFILRFKVFCQCIRGRGWGMGLNSSI